jgi:hypothetical protein
MSECFQEVGAAELRTHAMLRTTSSLYPARRERRR